MKQLPEGWTECQLKDCVSVLDSQRIPINSDERSKRYGNVPYYGATGQVGWIDDFLFNEELLLIGEDGAPFFDKTKPISYIIQGRSWVNNHAHVLRAIDKITSNLYLKYYLDQFDFHDYVNGTTRLKLTQGSLNRIPVKLAPLNEQRRIVTKVEQLLNRVRTAQERLETIPGILNRFRQSVLAAACSGRLTSDWRQQELNGPLSSFCFLKTVHDERSRLLSEQRKRISKPVELDFTLLGELPPKWSWASIDQLATKVVDGVHKKPHYVDSGIPFLTVRNLTAGSGISFERTTFITPQDHLEFIKRANPEKGDILVTKDGTLGTVRLIETDRVFSIFVSLALIKPVIRSSGSYLALVLAAPQVQQSIVKTGTGLQHIHLRDLRAVAVPVPPEEEQHEIVRHVQALFQTADALQARYLKAKFYVDKLTQSILAKAFRGELASQDPNDEPASVLLERLAGGPNGSDPINSPRTKHKRRST